MGVDRSDSDTMGPRDQPALHVLLDLPTQEGAIQQPLQTFADNPAADEYSEGISVLWWSMPGTECVDSIQQAANLAPSHVVSRL